MRIIKTFTKDVVVDQVEILDLCDNENGSTVVGDVYIDLQADNNVAAEGSVDGETWHAVKVVNMCDFTTGAVAAEAGYYMVPASGLAKLKFTFGAAGTITIKETY